MNHEDLWTDVVVQLRDHVPTSEAGVREVIAQSARRVFELGPSGVEVESSWRGKRIDVRVKEPPIVIELKYHRAIPSGRSRPMTMQFGQLLADVRKLAEIADGSDRVLVLLADMAGVTHLRNKELFPLSVGSRRAISASNVRGLAPSASGPALAGGLWIDVDVTLLHRAERIGAEGFEMLVWRTDPHPATE